MVPIIKATEYDSKMNVIRRNAIPGSAKIVSAERRKSYVAGSTAAANACAAIDDIAAMPADALQTAKLNAYEEGLANSCPSDLTYFKNGFESVFNNYSASSIEVEGTEAKDKLEASHCNDF